MLSLVAGSAIDEYLLSQLRLLRQEHTLARLIHGLQNMLWPGGTWFQSAPNYPGKAPPRVGTSHLALSAVPAVALLCQHALASRGSTKVPKTLPQAVLARLLAVHHSARALNFDMDNCWARRWYGCAAPVSSAAAPSRATRLPPLPAELPQPQVLHQPLIQWPTASVQDPNVPPPRPALVTAEQFLQQPDAPPLDHEEINEAVYELLLSKGPPVLVRLIGRNCYQV